MNFETIFDVFTSCLYHTTTILLHRPDVADESCMTTSSSASECLDICVSSASAIRLICDLFRRSFGSGHCTMALSYSLYTAASTFLMQIQRQDDFTLGRLEELQNCVLTLQEISAVNPGKLFHMIQPI